MKAAVVWVLGTILWLGGCANPVASSYIASGAPDGAATPADRPVEVRWVKDLDHEGATLRAGGGRLMGTANFDEVVRPSARQIEAQARRAGADLVLGVRSRGKQQSDEMKLTRFDDRQPVYPQTSSDPNPPSRVVETTLQTSYRTERFRLQFWRRPAPSASP